MNDQDRIAELEAELACVKSRQGLAIKIGNKENVVVGGLTQRFPVTLYAPDWMKIIENIDQVKEFIEANKDQLSWSK